MANPQKFEKRTISAPEKQEEPTLITLDESLVKQEQENSNISEIDPKKALSNFRLVVKNPFGKYRKIGQTILNADEVQAVIDSGNLRNCCKSTR